MSSDQSNFASRAGAKLEHALNHFQLLVEGKVCADFGSSTGGFVDCLLKRGAKKVYSVDVSYGELAWTLRNDSRVVVMERTNALHVTLPEQVDFISVDVGFTRQELVLPSCIKNLKSGGVIVSLLKPHYEAKKHHLVKGKLPDEAVLEVVQQVKLQIEQIPEITLKGVVESPIKGERGKNTEFLLFITKT